MRVLDLRSRPQRWLEGLWRRPGGAARRKAGAQDPAMASRNNRLLGWSDRLVDAIIARRVAGRRMPPGSPLIVSVGNLALGGTGKTPVVVALAADLARAGRQGAVLTRGYRSTLAGPAQVAADDVLAGDEARLMAEHLDAYEWPVVQARRRSAGLDFLCRQWPDRDVIIVEDGHQTADLGRHLDIVLLDTWTVAGDREHEEVLPLTGLVFPFGPYRESSRGAGRAAIWVVETVDPLPKLGRGGARVVSFRRETALVDVTRQPRTVVAPAEVTDPVALLSGIAQPAVFEAGLRRLLPRPPVLAVRFADHAEYGPTRAHRIAAEMERAGCRMLVTTAKDWVKLAPFWRPDLPVLVAELSIVWGDGKTLPQLVEERLVSAETGH